MALPPSKFYKAGEELFSLLFFNGRLYPLRNLEPSTSNFFYFLGKKFDIVKSERLDFLEDFYFMENQDIIENKIINSIDEKLGKISNEEVHKSNNPLKVIIDEIIPQANSIIFDKEQFKKKKKNKIVKNVTQNEKLNFVDSLYKNLINKSIFYNEVLEKNFFIIINKQVFNLKKTSNVKNLKQYLSFFNSFYSVEPKESLISLESKFQKNIDNYLDKLIDNYLNSITSFDCELRDRKRINNISNSLRNGNYEDRNVGLSKCKNDYYVYLKLPSFVLKNYSNGDLYLFDPVKIGTKLKVKANQLSLPNKELFVLHNYKHPYVWDNYTNEDGYFKICYGATDLSILNSKPLVEKVVGSLRKGYNIIYRPSMKKTNPVHSLDEFHFRSQKISSYDIRRLGLEVTNTS